MPAIFGANIDSCGAKGVKNHLSTLCEFSVHPDFSLEKELATCGCL